MAKEKTHNQQCGAENHSEHLCYIIAQGFNLTDKKMYEKLIKDPKYRCENCRREAHSRENLCNPKKL